MDQYLGADLGFEIVLVQGVQEFLDGEGDAVHGGRAASFVGRFKLLLEPLPLPSLRIGA